jgi:hypothetical protein
VRGAWIIFARTHSTACICGTTFDAWAVEWALWPARIARSHPSVTGDPQNGLTSGRCARPSSGQVRSGQVRSGQVRSGQVQPSGPGVSSGGCARPPTTGLRRGRCTGPELEVAFDLQGPRCGPASPSSVSRGALGHDPLPRQTRISSPVTPLRHYGRCCATRMCHTGIGL